MSDPTRVDSDWSHLWPEFRERLQKVLAETSKATGYQWVMLEGYRSQERQTWLYAQGRTRPGQIVTWMKTPKNHGSGCAADCYPTRNGKTPDFSIGKPAYDTFRSIYQKHGLENGAWGKGDLGHVELTDPQEQAKARKWIAAGFPETKAVSPIRMTFNGIPLKPGEDYLVQNGRGYLWVGHLNATWDPGQRLITVVTEDGS